MWIRTRNDTSAGVEDGHTNITGESRTGSRLVKKDTALVARNVKQEENVS